MHEHCEQIVTVHLYSSPLFCFVKIKVHSLIQHVVLLFSSDASTLAETMLILYHSN